MRHAGLQAAQFQAHLRTFERLLEEVFGLLIAGFDTVIESLGHGALRLQSAALCQRRGLLVRTLVEASLIVHSARLFLWSIFLEAIALALQSVALVVRFQGHRP